MRAYVGISLWITLIASFNGYAQHLGAGSDNYLTTQQVIYNPASIADPKPFGDIRIAGMSALVTNNYLYFPDANFRVQPLDNFQDGKKYNAYSELDVYGPAFTRAYKHMAFGVNIRVRNHLIARRVPSSIAKFAFEGLNYPPQHYTVFDEKRFWIKDMAWGELGITYSQLVVKRGNVLISAGGTVKLLNGLANVSFIGKELMYEVDSSDLEAINYQGQLVLTLPGPSRGWGTGLDAGIEYKKMLTDDNSYHVPHHVRGNCEVKDYKYKIGLSMLDLGFINFNKNTSNYKFEGDSIYLEDYVANPPSGITDISNTIDNAIDQSGAEVEKKEKSFSTLPLSFVLQGDYNFENYIYLNAQLLVGMRQINFSGAERMTTFTLTPRYEREKFTIAIPISLYRYGKPGVGFYARAWWLSAGVNNVVPLLFKTDMYGADAFVSLNIPLFRSRPCKAFIEHKGDYCPKPKLKLFDFNFGGKKKSGGKTKKKAERKKVKRVRKNK